MSEAHNATVLVRGDMTVNDTDAEAVLRAFILARLVRASLPRGLHWMDVAP